MKTHLGPAQRDFHSGEFALVILLAFGLGIVQSLTFAFSGSNRPVEFGDNLLAGTLGYQLIFGTIVWLVLRPREWRWSDFAVHYSNGTTVLGFLLAGLILAIWYVLELVMGPVPNEISGSMPLVLAVSIVNPLFEELLVLAYVVQSMRKRFGLNIAMNVSIAIRVSYHLYQGPLIIIPIAVFGVIMTLVYVRLGRLWPVIVAHAILDFVALVGCC
jgi:membrane protease YdiL (CAAX protease family)